MILKSLRLTALLLGFIKLGLAQEIPTYTSPIVHKDRTVEFNIYAPKAQEISLVSTLDIPNNSFVKYDDGLWSLSIGPVPPEIYHYQFEIDKVKISDPKNQSPYPWLDAKSELIIPGSPALLHEVTNVPHGTLHDHVYYSSTTKSQNKVTVYTPPNYNAKDDREYPILFLLHGFGEKVSFWSDFGKINLIVDNLIAEKKIVEPIIVMPNGDPLEDEYYKFFSGQIDGNAWMKKNMEVLNQDFHTDLIPFLKSNYAVNLSKETMAICGSSMGGIQSILLGVENVNEFDWIIGLSTSMNVPAFDIKNKTDINNLKLFQLNIGKKDDWGFNQSNKVHNWLQDSKIKHNYVVSEGGHDWDVWRKDMIILLPQLFRE